MIDARPQAMRPLTGGYFELETRAPAGTRYAFRLNGEKIRPDPCSRSQPEGPHAHSEVIDPTAFAWSDEAWRGLRVDGQVLYEMHVGTFSPSGDWRGATERLGALRELGISCIEVMPVAAFPGRFNWGYDGVNAFAPCAIYGRPDDFRRFVDRAHALGLGVILDVVYNHFGPDGNYLRDFSPLYFTDRYPAEWGEPVRFENAPAVRDFVTQNVAHWIAEYHLDGLRLDATQNLYDDPESHIVAEIVSAAREAAGEREVLIFCENEQQNERLTRAPSAGGYGASALWVDDFHHSARVALTGGAEAYLQDYRGSARELLACALDNGIYQGQWYTWQNKGRGTPLLDKAPQSIVFYLQNHDQIANTLDGARMHEAAGARLARALTTYFLLLPQTPLLFQGQEMFASAPFTFFSDHEDELQRAVQEGRTAFLRQFPSLANALAEREVDVGEAAFERSRIDWSERGQPLHQGALTLHRELLRLRRSGDRLRGATLNDHALVLRFIGASDDRLLVLNLAERFVLTTVAEPLLAPPRGAAWEPLLHSEEARFAGAGAELPAGTGPWIIAGKSAFLLRAQKGNPP